MMRIRRLQTDELSPDETNAIRELLRAAFAGDGDGFSEDDWAHTTGGTHIVVDEGAEILAHAAVVERPLIVDGHALRTGYVEGVATVPARQGHGLGTLVMREVGLVIDEMFEFGALSTARPGFYERLGWRRWTGPTSVATATGIVPTPDDDGGILYLATPLTPAVDRDGPIICDPRHGDPW
jgi:aminoglycoside 2'-N-acetyltransferase I